MILSKSKEKRIEIFNQLSDYFNANHLDWLNSHPAQIYSAKTKSSFTPLKHNQLKINFNQEYSLDSILNLKGKTAVLIFGSQKNPGGGVTRGTVAQEEDISLCTSWYFQAKQLTEYYNLRNKFDAINSDEIIFAPGLLIKDPINQNYLLSPKEIYFIAGAAPNFTGLVDSIGLEKAVKRLKEVENKILLRIEKVLSCAEENQINNLILGAWGCGVFGLDAGMVANAFYQAINKNLFNGNIVFAIPDQKINVFIDKFKNKQLIKP